MSETLIAFGTRYGATPESCAEIQKILEKEYNQHVEIWDLKDFRACPDLDDFDNVIVASGIENGNWTKNTELYLENNNFEGKKVAVFISSGLAGEEDLYEQAYDEFLVQVLIKYPHVKPVAIEAFGGRIALELLPKIADPRLLGRLHKHQYDNRDWDKIRAWAHKVGKLFSEN